MAIVTGPLHSSEARGVVGGKTGLVYNSHRGRAYVKANATPLLEYTGPQVATRALMVPIIAGWQALSDVQRDAWADFARENHGCDWTGQLKTLSAWNWYAKVNSPLQYCSEPLLNTPPNPVSAYLLPGLAYASSLPDVEINWTPATPVPSPDWLLIFWQTALHLPSVHPSLKHAKRATWAPEIDGSVFLTVAAAGFVTVYIQPVSTQGISMPPTRMLIEVT